MAQNPQDIQGDPMPGADCNGFGPVIDGLLPLDPNHGPANQTHNINDFMNWGQPLVPAMRQPDPVEAPTRQLEIVRAIGENDTRRYEFQRRENDRAREVQCRQLLHERDMVRDRMAQDAEKHEHEMERMAAQHGYFRDRVKIVMDAIRSLGALGLFGLLVWIGYLVGRQSGLY